VKFSEAAHIPPPYLHFVLYIQPAILGKENAANASDVGANKNANDVGVQRIVHISHKLFLVLLLVAKLEAKLGER